MSDRKTAGSEELRLLSEELARLGFSELAKWVGVVLFARNVVTAFSSIGITQKKSIQSLVLKAISERKNSSDDYTTLVRRVETVLSDNDLTASMRSQLSLYKSQSLALAETIVEFLVSSLEAERGRDIVVRDFAEEALDVLSKADDVVTLVPQMRSLIESMLSHYKDEAHKWEARAKALERAVNVDPLLGVLHNRRALDTHLDAVIRERRETGAPVSVLMIDIDDFKKTVNDVHGHKTGDEVLKALAGIIASHAENNGFFAARYGGDELVMVCGMNAEEAKLHAEAIRFGVQRHDFRTSAGGGEPASVRFTISVGVAEYHGSWSAEEFLQAADQAMFQVKGRGKNNVSVFCVQEPDAGQH